MKAEFAPMEVMRDATEAITLVTGSAMRFCCDSKVTEWIQLRGSVNLHVLFTLVQSHLGHKVDFV